MTNINGKACALNAITPMIYCQVNQQLERGRRKLRQGFIRRYRWCR
jgi:hypothetical protein